MELDRALVLLGVFAAALGGYLTHLHSLYPAFTELNPFSAYHVAGAWFPAVKVLGAFALYPLTKWCLEAWDRSQHQSRVWSALTGVLVFDLIGNLWVGGFSWVNHAAFELPSAWIAGFAVLSVLVVLYRDQVFRHKRSIAAGVLLTGVLLVMVPAVDAQGELVQSFTETDVTNGGNDIEHDSSGFVYVSNDTGLHVLNSSSLALETSDETNIEELNDIELEGDTLWGAGANGQGEIALFEFDVSSPQNPTKTVTAVENESGDVPGIGREVAVTDNFVYIYGTQDHSNFDFLAQFQGGVQQRNLNESDSFTTQQLGADERVYAPPDGTTRVEIYNDTLFNVGTYNPGSCGTNEVEVGTDYWYLGCGGFNIIEKSDNPSVVSDNSNAYPERDYEIRGDTAWITQEIGAAEGTMKLDISDKLDPKIVLENTSNNGPHGDAITVNAAGDTVWTVNSDDQLVYRISTVVGQNSPVLSNGRPDNTDVKPQPTLKIDVEDADFPNTNDEVNVSFYDFDSGDFIDNTTLTSNGTASVTWSSADHSSTHRWLAIATDVDGRQDTSDVHTFSINNDAPTLTNPTPRNDALRTTTGSVTLEVDVTDPNLPDNDTVNVSWWNASNDNRLDSVEATSNGTVSGTWSSVGRGYHRYYVNATDNASNTFTTVVRRFKTPGQLSFYDASNGNLITDTLSVQVTGPGTQETITVSDGTFEWEDKTNLQDTEYSVQITSNNYATATFTIQDVALSHNIYLSPTSQDITFDLNDNSGNFPGGDTQLIIAEDITSDGDATNITAQNYFGSDDTVTFSLEQGETYELYVENTDTGDGRHVGTYTVPASSDTQTITISRAVGADWRIDDATASPSGTVENASGGVPLSINITNMDSNDIINVSFYNASNDDRIGSQEVTGSGTNTATQNWDVPPGVTRSWYVIASDENNVQRASNTFAFGTAGSIVIRDADTGNLITDTVTLNITRADGQTFDRSVTSGFFNWTNLSTIPQNEVSVEINESDHFATQLQLNTVAQNNTVFLVQMTGFTGTNLDVTFVLNDLTGNYQAENTTLDIRRSVSGNYTTVASGTFGAANVFGTRIESGVNYRLRIENNQGDVRELGSFETNKAGTYILDVGRVDWNFTDSGGYTWDAFMSKNDADQDIIRFQYNDTAGDTEYLDVQIYEQGNESQNTIYNQFDQGPFGEKVVTVQLTSDQADKTWVVEWEGERNGEVINGSRIVGGSPFDVPTNLDPKYLLFLVAGLILFTAGLGADENSPVIGVMVVGVAGMLWYLGWFEISVGILILAAILAIANKAAQPEEV